MQNSLLQNAKQLYLATRASTKKQSKIRNLELLWDVLESIRRDGISDYSIAEVGRRLELVGGLKTQSLRNTQGAQFRSIISTYADCVSGSKRYVAKSKSRIDQTIDMITDSSIRAIIRTALEDAKRLKITNDNLHAAFKKISLGAYPQAAIFDDPTAPPHISTNIELRPIFPRHLIIALEKGISTERLHQQGLVICDDGSLENQFSDKIFPPSFITAIQEVLRLYSSSLQSPNKSPDRIC